MSKKAIVTKIGSTVLVQSDNMTVLGHSYQASTYEDAPDSTEPKEHLVPAVHLDFIIMVNGKNKSFWWSFLVEEWDVEGRWKACDDQREWMMLHYMLTNLGYTLPDADFTYLHNPNDGPGFSQKEKPDPFGWLLLDNWITRIMEKDRK